MAVVRIGAVSYLNARPLVVGLESRRDRFAVRYDLPSTCARLLHSHEIDLGLIPSIEYLRGQRYAMVPDCAVASDGPVASVALFTKMPIERVRTLALDTSSRTSVALTRVMTAKYFGIAPRFIDEGPDLVLYYKYLMVLGGDAEYEHHFNEADALSPVQREYARAQWTLFKNWWSQWPGSKGK